MSNNNIYKALDRSTVILYILLVFLGWINIYSASYINELDIPFSFSLQWARQLTWIFFSFVIITIVLSVDWKFFESFAYFLYGISILVLILTIFIATDIKGARSWITLGSVSIQPAEFAKVTTAMALAKLITTQNFNFRNMRNTFQAFAITFFPSILILLQKDTGSAMVSAAFILVMYREGLSGGFLITALLAIVYFILSLKISIAFVSILVLLTPIAMYGFRKDWRVFSILAGIAATIMLLCYAISNATSVDISVFASATITIFALSIYFLVQSIFKNRTANLLMVLFLGGSSLFITSSNYIFNNILAKHQQSRVLVLLDMKDDPLGAEYNVSQSKIAIGSGGFFGQGFLKGTQTHYNFVPEQSTDFIFCTLGEEWGFLGTTLVIVLFALLIFRIIELAERQRSPFSRLYGYGVASIIFFHVTINIGMTIGLVPVIGIPLPFFSYGGSSLWGFTMLLFIFLRLDTIRTQNI